MNIRMLEKMVGDCLATKRLIYQYKSEVYSRKLKDVLSEIPNLNIPTGKYTKIKAKYDKDFNDVTIKDIVKQWNEVEKIFKVGETMLLKNITEGCVEICWLLPNDLVEHFISSATKNQSVKYGVQSATQELLPKLLYLKIGEAVMKDYIIGM